LCWSISNSMPTVRGAASPRLRGSPRRLQARRPPNSRAQAPKRKSPRHRWRGLRVLRGAYIAEEEAAIAGASEAGAIAGASDEAGAMAGASDEAGAMAGAETTSDELTTAEDDEDATATGVGVPLLKIQIRPMITITATMMMIQVLRFMGMTLV